MGSPCGSFDFRNIPSCTNRIGENYIFCWISSHVGIAGNEKADAAARSGLNSPIVYFKFPIGDFKSRIRSYFNSIWQNHWNNVVFNKLQPVKPVIGETRLSSVSRRRDEIVLHRARIGHTYFSHVFLLKKEAQPECTTCQCPASVEHILLKCGDFSLAGEKYYSVLSLFKLFNNVSSTQILDFLSDIDYFYHKF